MNTTNRPRPKPYHIAPKWRPYMHPRWTDTTPLGIINGEPYYAGGTP